MLQQPLFLGQGKGAGFRVMPPIVPCGLFLVDALANDVYSFRNADYGKWLVRGPETGLCPLWVANSAFLASWRFKLFSARRSEIPPYRPNTAPLAADAARRA